MADLFFIRLTDHVDAAEGVEVSWCLRRDGEPVQVHRGSLAQASEAAADAKVVVLVPGDVVANYVAHVPTQNRQKMLRAVPFALEELLADDVDDLHFALGKNLESGGVMVAVASQEQMQAWQSQSQQLGLDVQMMLPEYLAIPYEQDTWHLLIEEDQAQLRMGEQLGCHLDRDTLDFMLDVLLQEAENKPQRLLITNYSDVDLAPLQQRAEALGIEVAVHDEGSLLEMVAKDFKVDTSFNLLQGSYSRREQMGRYWKPWLPTAAVLACLVVVQLGAMTADHFRLSNQVAQLESDINQLYLKTFPDATKVVNARVQMEQRLKALGGSGGSELFYLLLSGISYLNENKVEFELQRLRFQDDELSVDLNLKNLQDLDQIKALLLKKTEMVTEVLSASARGDKVEARLLLKGAAS